MLSPHIPDGQKLQILMILAIAVDKNEWLAADETFSAFVLCKAAALASLSTTAQLRADSLSVHPHHQHHQHDEYHQHGSRRIGPWTIGPGPDSWAPDSWAPDS